MFLPLVDVDGDEGLVEHPEELAQLASRLIDQQVEEVQKELVCGGHGLAVELGIVQCAFSSPRPQHLDVQQRHLPEREESKVENRKGRRGMGVGLGLVRSGRVRLGSGG